MNRRFVWGGLSLAVLVGLFSFRLAGRELARAFHLSLDPKIEAIRKKAADKIIVENPEIRRPMATYRLHEDKFEGGVTHRGGGYVAQTTAKGLHFEVGGSYINLRAKRLVQGDTSIECGDGDVTTPAFGDVRIDRGCLVEQYIFENTRTEQIFRIQHPIGTGNLRLTVAVDTGFGGKIKEYRRNQGGWLDTTLQDGGLAFTDEKGQSRVAYHGAVAIDALGERADLDPHLVGGEIALELPASFMAKATYPVAIDPWLELNFSASNGGFSNGALLSQTPSIYVVGNGNPGIAWSEQIVTNGITHFQIFFRYWNGVNWSPLGTSDQGSGISNDNGNAINPSVVLGEIGPWITWQDDSSGSSNVEFRHWDGTTFAEFTSTTPFDSTPTETSANTSGGISFSLGNFSGYPSLMVVEAPIPSQNKNKFIPIIAYESTNPGVDSIIVVGFYPGDPGAAATFNPVTGAVITPNFPTIPAGWYALGGGSTADQYPGIQMSNTAPGAVSQRPSLGFGTNGPIVAWQDTSTGTHNIMVAQYIATGFPPAGGVPGVNLPIFPAQRPPDFAFGNWFAMDGVNPPAPIFTNPVNPAPQPFSILPSLSIDSNGNPGVAWQQSFTVQNSDIFYATWNGANWVAQGGSTTKTSATTGGVSNTGLATTPSLTFNGTTPFITWSDASPTNSEIFVRSLAAGGASWNEVGFASNSASTVAAGGIGGISQTLGASLTPVIAANGDVTVAWQDFDGGTDQIYVRRFFQNEPLALRQTTVGGVAVVPFGSTIPGSNTIELRATAFSEDTSRSVRMQVEIVPVGTPFQGNVTENSGEVAIDANPLDATFHQSLQEMVVQFTGLENTNYQWRARTVDNTGAVSGWISAGGSDGVTDFTAASASIVAPGIPQTLIISLLNNQVLLTWTAPPGGADSYNVKRSGVAGGGGYPPATIISVAGQVTNTTFTDTTALSGQTYFYVVSSVRAGLESGNSNEVSITVPGGAGGLGGNADQIQKHRCGVTGAEILLALGGLAWLRRRRRR